LSFDVLSARSDEWLALWSSWPEREVWAHPGYASLYGDERSRVHCAVWRSDDGCVLYPLLLRDLRAAPFHVEATDTITPYGYGGPFFWGRDRDLVARRFWPAYDAWAQGERVVSELVRFALFEHELLPYPGERVHRLVNVVRELDADEDAIWMDFEHKVRKNVKRARRSGVRIEFDEDGARLDDFLRIYEHTLERRDAPARYRFRRRFFEAIGEGLRGQFVYVHALHDGRVVSSELALVSAQNVYSFLGGTDGDAYELRPNDLLKHELILWAKRAGKRRFVLGGGYRAEDGIFRYKRSFAPRSLVPFEVGQRILDAALYTELRARTGTAEGEDFFPAYRA
jgi:hypothetical protein